MLVVIVSSPSFRKLICLPLHSMTEAMHSASITGAMSVAEKDSCRSNGEADYRDEIAPEVASSF